MATVLPSHRQEPGGHAYPNTEQNLYKGLKAREEAHISHPLKLYVLVLPQGQQLIIGGNTFPCLAIPSLDLFQLFVQ